MDTRRAHSRVVRVNLATSERFVLQVRPPTSSLRHPASGTKVVPRGRGSLSFPGGRSVS